MSLVDIRERDFLSILFDHKDFDSYAQTVKKSKWERFTWKGRTLMKDPQTVATYQQLLQNLKPKTIIEFGTFDGGSALWMHDILRSIHRDFVIHTFDINDLRVKKPLPRRIKFHQLNNYQIKEFVSNNHRLFERMKRPVLFIEDSHENFVEVLCEMDKYMHRGDYLVVEDTLDYDKYQEMKEFVTSHNYLVDTFYCDLWGHNGSWNVNSYLTKINTN